MSGIFDLSLLFAFQYYQHLFVLLFISFCLTFTNMLHSFNISINNACAKYKKVRVMYYVQRYLASVLKFLIDILLLRSLQNKRKISIWIMARHKTSINRNLTITNVLIIFASFIANFITLNIYMSPEGKLSNPYINVTSQSINCNSSAEYGLGISTFQLWWCMLNVTMEQFIYQFSWFDHVRNVYGIQYFATIYDTFCPFNVIVQLTDELGDSKSEISWI